MTGYIYLNEAYRLFTYKDSVITLYFDKGLTEEINIDFNSENLCLSEDDLYLLGYDIENGKKIIFFVNEIPKDIYGCVRQDIMVYSYICYNGDIMKITGMQFYNEEINYFGGIRKGYQIEIENMERFSLITNHYADTKEEFEFNDGSENIKCTLSKETSLNLDTITPISIQSILSLHFNDTNDYELLRKRYYIVKQFFSFICYRKNIDFRKILLLGRDENDKMTIIGTIHNNYKLEKEDERIVKKTVKYDLLKSHIKDIFELISNDNLYTEHIPSTYNDRLKITPSRFILITAAFEWSIRGIYNIPISEKQERVKNDILRVISDLKEKEDYNHNLRKQLEFYKKIIENIDSNLSKKISYALKDLSVILEKFIKNIYKINGRENFKYSEIAERIQNQRNNYAHGNIDKDINTNVILDIIILEWVNYAMILKKLGYKDEEIIEIIKVIFNRNVI